MTDGQTTLWETVSLAAQDLITREVPGSLLVLSILANVALVWAVIRCYRRSRYVASN